MFNKCPNVYLYGLVGTDEGKFCLKWHIYGQKEEKKYLWKIYGTTHATVSGDKIYVK